MVKKLRRAKKESYQNIFFSVFLVFLFVAVIGLLFVSNWRLSQKRTELNSRIEVLKQEIGVLEKQNQELKTKISESQKESFLEKEAREKFNLKKPGEEVVVVVPEESKKENPKEKEKIWWNPLTW